MFALLLHNGGARKWGPDSMNWSPEYGPGKGTEIGPTPAHILESSPLFVKSDRVANDSHSWVTSRYANMIQPQWGFLLC